VCFPAFDACLLDSREIGGDEVWAILAVATGKTRSSVTSIQSISTFKHYQFFPHSMDLVVGFITHESLPVRIWSLGQGRAQTSPFPTPRERACAFTAHGSQMAFPLPALHWVVRFLAVAAAQPSLRDDDCPDLHRTKQFIGQNTHPLASFPMYRLSRANTMTPPTLMRFIRGLTSPHEPPTFTMVYSTVALGGGYI